MILRGRVKQSTTPWSNVSVDLVCNSGMISWLDHSAHEQSSGFAFLLECLAHYLIGRIPITHVWALGEVSLPAERV